MTRFPGGPASSSTPHRAAVHAVAAGLLLVVAPACLGSSSASPRASSEASAGPGAQAPGRLDPTVPMPSGFPSDVPVYPGSRLTAGASFSSSGQTTWGMEWETLDSVDKVQAFYSGRFAQGDWTIKVKTTSDGSFSAVYARKSNSKDGGLIGAGSAGGVTTITLSLINSG